MSVIPCEQNKQLRKKIKDFAETLKTESHTLGDHSIGGVWTTRRLAVSSMRNLLTALIERLGPK